MRFLCFLVYLFHIQNEIKRLYNQLIKKKMVLQQSLNAIGGQSIGEQLQVTNQNSSNEADLRPGSLGHQLLVRSIPLGK